MSPEAAAILGALVALTLRALVALLWHSVTAGSARECDEDLGDAGTGDTRIYLFEGPRMHKLRLLWARLTGWW